MPANYIFPRKMFHKLSTVPLLWQMEAVLDLTPKKYFFDLANKNISGSAIDETATWEAGEDTERPFWG